MCDLPLSHLHIIMESVISCISSTDYCRPDTASGGFHGIVRRSAANAQMLLLLHAFRFAALGRALDFMIKVAGIHFNACLSQPGFIYTVQLLILVQRRRQAAVPLDIQVVEQGRCARFQHRANDRIPGQSEEANDFTRCGKRCSQSRSCSHSAPSMSIRQSKKSSC